MKIKKDALWKPLLRKFRQWTRTLLVKFNLAVGSNYWSFKRMFS